MNINESLRDYGFQPFLPELRPRLPFEAMGLNQDTIASEELGGKVGNEIATLLKLTTLPIDIHKVAQMVGCPVIARQPLHKDKFMGTINRLPKPNDSYYVIRTFDDQCHTPSDRRMTVAHEIGHAILTDTQVNYDYLRHEAFCEAFGANILSPTILIEAEVALLKENDPLRVLEELSRKFQLPLHLLVKRLVELDILSGTLAILPYEDKPTSNRYQPPPKGWLYYKGKKIEGPMWREHPSPVFDTLLVEAQNNNGSSHLHHPDYFVGKWENSTITINRVTVTSKVITLGEEEEDWLAVHMKKGEQTAVVNDNDYFIPGIPSGLMNATRVGM